MKIKITFSVPPGITHPVSLSLLQGSTFEADGYNVDPRTGWLSIFKIQEGINIVIGTWAPGVVRSCIDVGEFEAAVVKADENPRRRA